MKTMYEIVEEIKDIISHEVKGRVKDADVAEALGVNRQLLATCKNRNKIMYAQLLDFFAKRGLCINTFLYKQSVQSLVKNTNKYELNRFMLAS